jgi:hypothetical protein
MLRKMAVRSCSPSRQMGKGLHVCALPRKKRPTPPCSCFFKLSLADGRVLASADVGRAGSQKGSVRGWSDFEVVKGPLVCNAFLCWAHLASR